MAYSEKARQYAADTLQHRRHSAAMQTEQRRSDAYLRIPALGEINTRINAIGIAAVRALVAGEDAGIRASMDAQIGELDQQRRTLLSHNGFPQNQLDEIHICHRCNDSGIDPEGKTCSCAHQLLREYARREIGEVSPLSLCEFESFSLDFYSKDVDAEFELSPYEVMRDNLAECRGFARNFPGGAGNLLMMGDAGLGKTHLALSIANEVLRRGYEVLYCSAANIFRQIEAEQFNNNRDTTTLDSLKRCDLLILDDLGAEHTGFYVNSVLYDIVNTRLNRSKPTLYTTNLTSERILASRYGEKISSRLIGCSKTLPFIGDDIRQLKNID